MVDLCIVQQIYYFLIFLYYTIVRWHIISSFLSSFWRCISLFRCFFTMFICNCFRTILLRRFWDFCNSVSDLITSQVTSWFCCFWITLFGVVLSAFVADCLAWSRSAWLYWPLKFLRKFLSIFYPYFFSKDNNP